ncbi:MAG: DUF3972 domain-containing protein [Epsilonproteobacteria bacterium]|nr:DUF3972 domain-containing protein [Campylobacterota bacterium]
MQNWLKFDEFCMLVDLDKNVVQDMIDRGVLTTKTQDGELYIEADKGAIAVMPKKEDLILQNSDQIPLGTKFVEKTIGTILQLHKEVLDGKDETLEALKSENEFLKEALLSMQTLYDEDRKTVENLNEQLKIAHKELEFCRRKYKMMWNKAVENYKG